MNIIAKKVLINPCAITIPQIQHNINKKLPTYGNIVTYKKGGEGNHNFGKAIDVYFKKNGKIITDKLITPEVAQIGKNLGLTWGGDWKNFKDFPHFELK